MLVTYNEMSTWPNVPLTSRSQKQIKKWNHSYLLVSTLYIFIYISVSDHDWYHFVKFVIDLSYLGIKGKHNVKIIQKTGSFINGTAKFFCLGQIH